MNPLALLILALLSPLLIAATLLAPIYGGIALSTCIIYDKAGKAHPLAGKFTDVTYISDVYVNLFAHWSQHMGAANIWHYTLPLVGFPLLGLMISYWLTRKLSRRLYNMFQSGHGH